MIYFTSRASVIRASWNQMLHNLSRTIPTQPCLPLLEARVDTLSCEVWKRQSKAWRAAGTGEKGQKCHSAYTFLIIHTTTRQMSFKYTVQIHSIFSHSHEMFLHLQFCHTSKAKLCMIRPQDQETESLSLSRLVLSQAQVSLYRHQDTVCYCFTITQKALNSVIYQIQYTVAIRIQEKGEMILS